MSDVPASRITVPALTFVGSIGLFGGAFWWAATMQQSTNELNRHAARGDIAIGRLERAEVHIDGLRADVERIEAGLLRHDETKP